MNGSYNKLWKLLADKKMSKIGLHHDLGLSTTTMTKLRKDEDVSMIEIYKTLSCDVGNILEFTPEPRTLGFQ